MNSLRTFYERNLSKKINIITNEITYYLNIVNFYIDEKKSHSDYGIYKTFSETKLKLENIKENLVKINITKDNIQLIVEYDVIRKLINKNLEQLKMIVTNLVQDIDISFFHYLPQVSLNRSYSYKAVHEFLQQKINSIIKDNFYNIYWDFQNEFLHKDNFIITNFYYQDMPELYPLIGHEMGHILLQNDKKLSNLKEKIFQKISNYLNCEESYWFNCNALSEEIIADLISFVMFKDAFSYAFLEEVVGYGMANAFYDFDNGSFILSSDFSYFENNFIRFFILKYFRKEIKMENEKLDNLFDEAEYYLKELEKYYVNSLYKDIFIYYFKAYEKIINDVIEILVKEYNNLKYLDKWENSELFLDIWESGCIDCSGYYRKKVIQKISTQFKDKNLAHKALIFGKLRIKDIKEEDLNSIYYNKNSKNFCFGIFNFVELKDMENFKEEESKGKWFSQKNLVIELVRNESNKKGDFGVIVMMDVERDYYRDFDNVIGVIVNKIQDELSGLSYEIYKSLGPKELVVIVRNLSADEIFEIKQKLSLISRTYSIVFLNKEVEEINLGNSCVIKVLVRTKNNFDIKESEYFYTPGIYDYEIILKGNITMEEIFKYLEDNNISDVQFRIEKMSKDV